MQKEDPVIVSEEEEEVEEIIVEEVYSDDEDYYDEHTVDEEEDNVYYEEELIVEDEDEDGDGNDTCSTTPSHQPILSELRQKLARRQSPYPKAKEVLNEAAQEELRSQLLQLPLNSSQPSLVETVKTATSVTSSDEEYHVVKPEQEQEDDYEIIVNPEEYEEEEILEETEHSVGEEFIEESVHERRNNHLDEEEPPQQATQPAHQQHQQQQHQDPSHRTNLRQQSRGELETVPPSRQPQPCDDEQEQQQQQQQQQPEQSLLHDLVQASEWQRLLRCLERLGKEESSVIRQELTKIDHERRATPIHTAVWKAPLQLTKLLISIIPLEARQEILLRQDIDGNTPLHLACANLELKQEESSPEGKTTNTNATTATATAIITFDASVVEILAMRAPDAHGIRNDQGDIPLALLLTSPAMRARDGGGADGGSEAEAAAETLVRSMLNYQKQGSQTNSDDHDHDDDNGDMVFLTQNENGMTLLHAAAANGAHERVLMAVLDVAWFCAGLADKAGRLPLHYVAACISGKSPPALFAQRLVVAHPEAIVQPCNTGDTPLHLLVSNIQNKIPNKEEQSSHSITKLVELLLGSSEHESMCPLLVKNQEQLNPLHCCALFNAPPNVARILMVSSPFAEKAASMTDPNHATPLHLVCASSSVGDMVELVKILGTSESCLKRDAKDRTPMHMAAENPNSTKYTIKALADSNPQAATMETSKGRMPLHAALRKGASETVVRALLRANPEAVKVVFEGSNTLFHEICQYKTPVETVRGLLQIYPEGAQTKNKFLNLPLHVATAYQCDLDLIQALVEAYPEGCVSPNKNEDVPL
jgi:ankyrin repeat protein